MLQGRGRDHAVLAAVAIVVTAFYLWEVRSAGYPFNWNTDQPGYYNYLARGFAGGHLYLPIEPSPKLLAQPNPWDPNVDDSLKLFDAVLFQKRFYLYHGAGPVVMLFLPWTLLTGRDLPENFALFLFCTGGFIFSAASLLEVLERAKVKAGPLLLASLLLALGLCTCVPFLLSRVWVYEIAVGCGYFCVSAAVYFLLRGLRSSRVSWLIASGLLFGLAVACRPHLGIAGAAALVLVMAGSRRRGLALALPLVLAVGGIAAYNFVRFGNPMEFGNAWQLAGANQGRIRLSAANAAPGVYYLMFAKPALSPVFPWIEMPWPPREFPRPPEFYLEQTVGGLFLAPFLLAFPAIFFARHNRTLLLMLLVSGLAILVFVSLTGWSTQRYEVDFLPLLALAVSAAIAEVMTRAGGGVRTVAGVLLGMAIAFGCVVNLALGVSGPYWEMIKNKPARFVKIASRFSPVERHRPVLNPRVDVSFDAIVRPGPDHVRANLLKAGRFPHLYELYVEHRGGKPMLTSNFGGSSVAQEIEAGSQSAAFRVMYAPESGEMCVLRNGTELLRHRIGTLVAAPSQIVIAQP